MSQLTTIQGVDYDGRRMVIGVDKITNGLITMTSDHSYIHQGIKFSGFIKATILSGSTAVISFKTPSSKYIHYRPANINSSADKLDIEIFENAIINVAGTLVTAFNRNRLSTNLSTVEIRTGTTFTNNGNKLDAFSVWLPGSTGVGQSRSGATTTEENEIILKQDTVYRVLVTNGSTSSNVVSFNFNWYEID